MKCSKYDKLPCFDREHGYKPDLQPVQLRTEFFKFLSQKLKFEKINPLVFKRDIHTWPDDIIKYVFNEFIKDIANFAKIVCNFIAPNNMYINADIEQQNRTYVHFLVTNSFRYVKKNEYAKNLYVPENLEEILLKMNSSISMIYNDWPRLVETIKNFSVMHSLRSPQYQVHLQFDYFREFSQKFDEKGYLYFYSANNKRTQQLRDIHNRISEFKDWEDNESDIFKQIVANKFEDMSKYLIHSIIAILVDNFSQSLNKLNTWVDDNLQDLQKDSNISKFFQNLNKKVVKHFSISNAYTINFWLSSNLQKVPYDWQARLVGFDRPSNYWLMPEYEIDELEKTIFNKNMTFTKFVDIVDFYLRENLEAVFDVIESCDVIVYHCFVFKQFYWYDVDDVSDSSNNFTHFFEDWRRNMEVYEKKRDFIKVLQNKYEINFAEFPLKRSVRLSKVVSNVVLYLNERSCS
jgi:hypothetical protein